MVHRLMAKDPADRYQTPAELAAALVPFCSSSSWSMSPTRAEVPYIDPLATPADSDSANPAAVHLVRDHDASALAATLHVDSFPIPLGTSELIGLSRVTDYRDHRQSRCVAGCYSGRCGQRRRSSGRFRCPLVADRVRGIKGAYTSLYFILLPPSRRDLE